EPGIGRAVIERTHKSSSVRQRAAKRGEQRKFTRNTKLVAKRGRLKLKPREIGAVEGKGKSAKIATTKDGGIQNIDPFVINPFHNSASEIKAWIDDIGDCARWIASWITSHQSGKTVL